MRVNDGVSGQTSYQQAVPSVRHVLNVPGSAFQAAPEAPLFQRKNTAFGEFHFMTRADVSFLRAGEQH